MKVTQFEVDRVLDTVINDYDGDPVWRAVVTVQSLTELGMTTCEYAAGWRGSGDDFLQSLIDMAIDSAPAGVDSGELAMISIGAATAMCDDIVNDIVN
jgi:hypothetical protein